MRFEFATTPLIVFGPGSLESIGDHARRLGRRAWLVTGDTSLERGGMLDRVEALLAGAGVGMARQRVAREPDTAVVDEGAREARAAGCDVVIGIGGGSVLDTAKAVGCLMTNGGEALDYLEVVGRGKPVDHPSAPVIAVPTTGGTGSEVTRNAVIADPATATKASIRHASLLPRVAVLDPTLTHGVPRHVTASTGLDALVQLIEPYVSRRANPMIDALALAGVRRAAAALPRAYADGGDAEARADMMLAAAWSGMALAHCGLGAAHALAGPLGGSFPIPHGVACAATMPHVMAANLQAAARHPGGAETIRRYADVARAMGVTERPTDAQTARGAVERVSELCRDLAIPPLKTLGVSREAFADLVERARRTSSMMANPVDLDDEELAAILAGATG